LSASNYGVCKKLYFFPSFFLLWCLLLWVINPMLLLKYVIHGKQFVHPILNIFFTHLIIFMFSIQFIYTTYLRNIYTTYSKMILIVRGQPGRLHGPQTSWYCKTTPLLNHVCYRPIILHWHTYTILGMDTHKSWSGIQKGKATYTIILLSHIFLLIIAIHDHSMDFISTSAQFWFRTIEKQGAHDENCRLFIEHNLSQQIITLKAHEYLDVNQK